MYGTRDAPVAWSRLVRTMVGNVVFLPRRTSACVFVHCERGLQIVSHVGDFLCAGPSKDLAWLREQLMAEYDVDGDMLGHQPG